MCYDGRAWDSLTPYNGRDYFLNTNYVVHVVDDDSDYRDDISERLEEAGYLVVSSGTGEQFLDVFNPMERGCILMDERMPGRLGSQTLSIISKWLPVYPAILITGFANDALTNTTLESGIFEIIEKPMSHAELVLKVKEALTWMDNIWKKYTESAFLWVDLQSLNPRDYAMVLLISEGLPVGEIAKRLVTNMRAIERSTAALIEKMKAKSPADLIQKVNLATATFGPGGAVGNLIKARRLAQGQGD
jgi:FixJ family two-component response regulator